MNSRVFATIGALTILVAPASAQISRSAVWDLGALASDELRLSIEPVTLGRVAINVTVSRWADSRIPSSFQRTVEQLEVLSLESNPGRTELALGVSARAYPGFLASDVEERRLRAFVGLGVGLHRRTLRQDARFCRIDCSAAAPTRAHGIEPTGEVGIRFEPARRVLLDVGVRSRLVTFADPTERFARGDVLTHLTLALGFGW